MSKEAWVFFCAIKSLQEEVAVDSKLIFQPEDRYESY